MTTKHFIVCLLIYVVGTTANPDMKREFEEMNNDIRIGFQAAEKDVVKEFHKLQHAVEQHPEIFDDIKHEFQDIGSKIGNGFQEAEFAMEDEYHKVQHAIEDLKAVKKVILNACACTRYSCGCCAHLEEAQIELNATICTNITYLVHDYGISFTVTVNNFSIFNETVSARNPPPVCLGLPYVKELADVCVRLYDINATTTYLHACVRIEARMKMILIAKYDLGCVNLGPPGISFGAHLSYDQRMEVIQAPPTSGLVIPIAAGLGAIILIIAITVAVYFVIKKKKEDESCGKQQFMKRYGSTNYLVPKMDPYC